MLKDFIDARLAQWQKLEQYVGVIGRKRLTRLKREEVREFGRLYRRTAADLGSRPVTVAPIRAAPGPPDATARCQSY